MPTPRKKSSRRQENDCGILRSRKSTLQSPTYQRAPTIRTRRIRPWNSRGTTGISTDTAEEADQTDQQERKTLSVEIGNCLHRKQRGCQGARAQVRRRARFSTHRLRRRRKVLQSLRSEGVDDDPRRLGGYREGPGYREDTQSQEEASNWTIGRGE